MTLFEQLTRRREETRVPQSPSPDPPGGHNALMTSSVRCTRWSGGAARWWVAGVVTVGCVFPGAATPSALEQPARPAYGTLVAMYRSGDFVGAMRAGAALPPDYLVEHAASYRGHGPDESSPDELNLLAAALLHVDLAGVAGVAPARNEETARVLLDRVNRVRRDAWVRSSHLGLMGLHALAGRLADVARISQFLSDRYENDLVVLLNRARYAEVVGWALHDDRFLEQARSDYHQLLRAALSGKEALDLAEIRLRLAHLTLRGGHPREALTRLDSAGHNLKATHRFVALLIRGEALVWLGQTVAAEKAFTDAQALQAGSGIAAAALVTARQMLGNSPAAASATRRFLSQTTGEDPWWDFMSERLAAERRHLDALRRIVSERD